MRCARSSDRSGLYSGILHDLCIDETLRANFNATPPLSIIGLSMTRNLRRLRDAVVARLGRENSALVGAVKINDYVLYEIVGDVVRTGTTQYVDEARIYGYITISVLLSAFAYCLRPAMDHGYVGELVFAAAVLFVYFIGRELVKMQYRNRAIRLYVTYLFK